MAIHPKHVEMEDRTLSSMQLAWLTIIDKKYNFSTETSYLKIDKGNTIAAEEIHQSKEQETSGLLCVI